MKKKSEKTTIRIMERRSYSYAIHLPERRNSLLYFLSKRVGPKILDRFIDSALEQTDVNLYNKIKGKK